MFTTAPDAQLLDIEAAIDACPEPDQESSVAVRVTDVKYPSGLLDEDGQRQTCPVFDMSIEPEKCAYKSFASGVSTTFGRDTRQNGMRRGTWHRALSAEAKCGFAWNPVFWCGMDTTDPRLSHIRHCGINTARDFM